MEKKITDILRRWLICLVSLMAIACHEKESTILPNGVQLKEGDLVFRQGLSTASMVIMAVKRDECYSHVGIVVDSAGSPKIIHAIPDEHDFPGDVDRVKMDNPEIFFLNTRAKIGEIMRPKHKEAAHIAAKTAWRIYQRHTLFDHDYNLEDSTKMYCTELVLYAYRTAGVNLAVKPLQKFTFPIHFCGYLPSDIHASPELISIKVF